MKISCGAGSEMEDLKKSIQLLEDALYWLNKVEKEFGIGSVMGKREPSQREEAKKLQKALERELESLRCIVDDLKTLPLGPAGEVIPLITPAVSRQLTNFGVPRRPNKARIERHRYKWNRNRQ